ncbi:integration host factor subunit alpha [Thermodesulfovibrio hydrogeniphilus]
MTKADLVNYIFERAGLPKTEIQKIVETVFDTIKESLAQGENVKIAGFGLFNVRMKGKRIGRNPKTMETVEITPRKVVTFKPSEQLKEIIQKKT